MLGKVWTGRRLPRRLYDSHQVGSWLALYHRPAFVMLLANLILSLPGAFYNCAFIYCEPWLGKLTNFVHLVCPILSLSGVVTNFKANIYIRVTICLQSISRQHSGSSTCFKDRCICDLRSLESLRPATCGGGSFFCWGKQNGLFLCWGKQNGLLLCWGKQNGLLLCWGNQNGLLLCWGKQNCL